MSASNEWFDFHLTPQGWVDGSERLDFVGIKEQPVPEGTLITLRFHEELSSSFSSMRKWCEVTFSAYNDELNKLFVKFGNRPQKYSVKEYPFES